MFNVNDMLEILKNNSLYIHRSLALYRITE